MAQLDASAFPGRTRSLAERLPLRHVDLSLVFASVLLAVYGVMMVYSATHRSQAVRSLDPTYFVKRQAIFLVIGLIAMTVAMLFDYRLLRLVAPVAYVGFVLLLLLVQTGLGTRALGAQRAFSVGGFQISPSLFMRAVLIVTLAAYLSGKQGSPRFSRVLGAVVLAAIPILLVLKQPDIGTSIVLATILLAELVIAGVRARHLVVLALIAVIGVFGVLQTHMIKDWQLRRLTVFLDPTNNTLSAAYNLHQSEIAIGSGGVDGRGYLKGSQTNLAFVPEQQTDFIFTVVGEEFGFVGAIVLLMLFLLVLWRAYRIALTSRDPFGTYIAVGVAAMFTIQIFINVGMTIGIMPITGIPLPFISYGGSALIADFIGIGLLLNVHMRRTL